MKILFENAAVYTGEVLRNAYLAVENDKIKGIYDKAPDLSFDRKINCKGKLILPSFVNSHCHMPMTLLRGYAEGLPLDRWLKEKIFPAEEKLNSKLIKVGSELAVAEMVAGGITSVSDMYSFCSNIADVVVKTGIRANISRAMMSFDENTDLDKDFRFKEAINLFNDYNNAAEGRVLVDFSFHAEYTSNKPYILKVLDKLDFSDVRFHIHLSETLKENEECKSRHKMSPAAYFESLGLFKYKTTAGHCVHLSKEDIDILAENNVTVAHCPVSNLKLSCGIASIPAMLSKGVNVALGTDGAASNNNLSIMKEITTASLIAKGINNNPCIISEQQIIDFATKNGAAGQGRADIGCIKEGMKADITVINLDSLHQQPYYDELSALIYSSSASDVYLTMCNGKILYENKEYKTIDIEKLKYDVDNAVKVFRVC